jgi:hypothetical protein
MSQSWAPDAPDAVKPDAPAGELAAHVPEALLHLKSALRAGVPWHRAMLEAVGLWTLPQEVYQGREFRYLIQGEAFDWLLLAERFCTELDGLVPQEDKERLLFSGALPENVEPDLFRDLLGTNKYRAHLNYWYGVVVEEALQLAVEEEVRKRHLARCYADSEDLVEEAFTLLYGSTRAALIDEFRDHVRIPRRRALSISDVKEFTYWVHKRRLKVWDPARVASDTDKGIKRLRALERAGRRRTDIRAMPPG